MRYPSWLSADPWSASQLKDRVCMYSIQNFFFLNYGISSGADSPMDSGSVCFDMGGCCPDPSQAAMDCQHQLLYLGVHIQSNWRGRSGGWEPSQTQVSFLHVHTASLPQVGCGLTLGGDPLVLSVFQATWLKQGAKHRSWGDKCITGRKDSDTSFSYGQAGCVATVAHGERDWKGEDASSLAPSPCCSYRLL